MAGNMRRRILMLLRVFEEEMDDKHTLTMSEILKMLECRGIAADRRAIYEDIEELNNMGYEIIRASDGKRGYFLAERLFEDPEINMVAAAIRSFRFLSEPKTNRILDKVKKLASPKYRGRLVGRITRIRTPKSENNNVLYYLDQLSTAIAERRQISFYYYRLNDRKRREFLNDGHPCAVYPEKLLWHGENYYLIAMAEGGICHFRLDRMSELRMLKYANDDDAVCNSRELDRYIKANFEFASSYGDRVTLLCEKDCADEIFERFDLNTIVYAVTDTHFKADVTAAPGMWLYTALEHVVVPSSVIRIGVDAFALCTSLKQITLPEGLEEIMANAFRESGLQSIEIPASTKLVGSAAFYYTELETVILHEGLEKVEEDAFFARRPLKSIQWPKSIKKLGEGNPE